MAAEIAKGQRRDSDTSPQCLVAKHAAIRHPSDDERRRRNVHSLLGTELAPQSLGLQSRERNAQAIRRLANSQRIDGRRLALWIGGARAVLRFGRARSRSLG